VGAVIQFAAVNRYIRYVQGKQGGKRRILTALYRLFVLHIFTAYFFIPIEYEF
jgi:hypothetical protein